MASDYEDLDEPTVKHIPVIKDNIIFTLKEALLLMEGPPTSASTMLTTVRGGFSPPNCNAAFSATVFDSL